MEIRFVKKKKKEKKDKTQPYSILLKGIVIVKKQNMKNIASVGICKKQTEMLKEKLQSMI